MAPATGNMTCNIREAEDPSAGPHTQRTPDGSSMRNSLVPNGLQCTSPAEVGQERGTEQAVGAQEHSVR